MVERQPRAPDDSLSWVEIAIIAAALVLGVLDVVDCL